MNISPWPHASPASRWTRRKAQKNFLPLQLGDVPETFAGIDDLVRDVGYRPATPVEVGVKRFVD
jgi:UDP-glucuronate 4-epimerase